MRAIMHAEERLDQALQFLQQNGVGHLAELATHLGVSVSTVRRDLDELEQEGHVHRIRGGAVYIRHSESEPPWDSRWQDHADEKRRIAAAAAQLIREGEMVLLDMGSSNLYLAQQLHGLKRITVVTNSLPVMWEVGKDPDISLVALGGELYHEERYFRGPLVEQVLGQMRVDRLFLGISTIEAEYGLSEFHYTEVPLKRALIRASRQTIVLAHGAKVGRASHFRVCPVSDAGMLITDPSADPDEIRKLERAGMRVMIAGQGKTGAGAAGRQEMATVA
jgi:DeoR family fructose operon transcriptional repressor